MDPELKKRWVDALRSGKYKQCAGKLHDGEGFCCIGVLADIQGCEWVQKDCCIDPDLWCSSFNEALVPASGAIPYDDADLLGTKVRYTLIDMNDAGKSFDEIADYIDSLGACE